MAAAMGRAGGSSQVSRGQALGMGTELSSNLRLLADQGRKDADSGNSCFPDSEAGQLYPAPGHWGLKAPHSSGLAPWAAEHKLVCTLSQNSHCCRWGSGERPQDPGVRPYYLSVRVL